MDVISQVPHGPAPVNTPAATNFPDSLHTQPNTEPKTLLPKGVTQLRDTADLRWAYDKPPGSSMGPWSTPNWSLVGLGLLIWNLANFVQPFLPHSQPTRGLCPRLPESPSEGRGLLARQSQARPSETQPQTRAGHHCVSLPFHWLYLLRRRTQDSGPPHRQWQSRGLWKARACKPRAGMAGPLLKETAPKYFCTL